MDSSWALIFFSLFLFSSTSPVLGLIFLVSVSICVSLSSFTMFSSWFFFTILIFYVGGMMVMFLYLTSLMSSTKIVFKNNWMVYLAGSVLVVGLLMPSKGLFLETKLWLEASFQSSSVPLVSGAVGYLLLALILIFKLCEKEEGPMKSS